MSLKKLNRIRTKTFPCPKCGRELDGVTSIDGEAPKKLDPLSYSICFYCTSYLQYINDLEGWRIPDIIPKEAAALLEKFRHQIIVNKGFSA